MNNQFTASEVNEWANGLGSSKTIAMLRTFADLLEAQEIARNDAIEREYERENNPATPSDTARLAEALRPFAALWQPHHENMPGDRPVWGINGAEITAGDLRRASQAIAAHSAQAQPPAASVTDAMVKRAVMARMIKMGYNPETVTYSIGSMELMRAALEAALAAQENPNG